MPVVSAGRRIGAVRVTQSVKAVDEEVRSDVIALVGVGVLALALGLGVAWLLAGSLARPLRGLAGTARAVAGGDLDARARVEGSSEQREVAAAFNEMTERLARALRAQQEFVANASHQLRTPLTGLRLRLEAAALKSRDPEVERDLLAAERETERLARLLTELLTLARERERPEPQPVSLARVAREGAERWSGPAERSGHRLRAGGDGEPVVEATDADLAVILDNLVENALRYSPPETTVVHRVGRGGGNGAAGRAGRGSRDRARRSASACSSASFAARQAAAGPRARVSGCRWSRRWRGAGTARSRSSPAPSEHAPSCGCRSGRARANRILTASFTMPYPGRARVET